MSVAELLPAIRALPKAEQVQVLHLLIDCVAGGQPADDGIPEEVRKLLPPPGSVVPYREPLAGADVAEPHPADHTPETALLAKLFPAGMTFDVHTPPGGYEAAATLQQLLSSREEQK